MPEYLDKALDNPEHFTTIIILGIMFMFMIPLIWYMLKGQNKQNLSIIKEMKSGFNNIALAQNKTKLSGSMVMDVAKQKVWYASETKLAFIRGKLEKNNLKERSELIKKHIRDELSHQSSKYITYLNEFQLEINGELILVGNYVEDNFDMVNFLKEIYDVVFRDTRKDQIDIKINDCRFIMKSYQNSLFEKMRKDLGKN